MRALVKLVCTGNDADWFVNPRHVSSVHSHYDNETCFVSVVGQELVRVKGTAWEVIERLGLEVAP